MREKFSQLLIIIDHVMDNPDDDDNGHSNL